MGRPRRRSHAHSHTAAVTCENHGSTLVMRSKDLRTSKNKILKAYSVSMLGSCIRIFQPKRDVAAMEKYISGYR